MERVATDPAKMVVDQAAGIAVLFLRAFWTFEHEFSTPFLVTSLPVSQRDPGQQH